MDVLLVGAGAVGQVYGRHLTLGGARVSVLVKPKHASEARAGFTMYPLRRKDRRDPIRFEPAAVLTDHAEAHTRRWDQVWLCTSTPALEGAWLDALLAPVADATIVVLQPGLHVRERVAAIAGDPARVVSGAIGMVSYQAPLPGEAVPVPGVAYAFPLGAESRFSGAPERVVPIVETLRRGGCPARIDEDAQRFLSFTSAILVPHMAALDREGWSLGAFRRGDAIRTAAAASREAMRAVAAELRVRAPAYRAIVRALPMRVLFGLAPHMVPFDLEAYLGYHFTKVRDQTRMMLDGYVASCERHHLPHEALDALRG